MSLEILKKEVNKGILRKVYLFYGEEDYLKRLYCEKIEDNVLSGEFKELNKFVIEDKIDIFKIGDICDTVPCFSDKKLVILKNTGFFKVSKSDGKSKTKKNTNDEIKELIKNIPEYTCVIFYETEIDKRIKLIDAIKENGMVVEFGVQPANILVKWVVSNFKTKDKKIDNMVAAKLVEYCEHSMVILNKEMEKIDLYLGNKNEVNQQDIDEICTKSISVRIFDLIDSISVGNRDLALKNLNEIIILKEPVQKILFMIAKHIRQLLEMKTLVSEGLSVNESISKMKISPYAGNKMARQIKNFEIPMLKNVLKQILEFDYAIKNGKIKDRVAVEIIISLLGQR